MVLGSTVCPSEAVCVRRTTKNSLVLPVVREEGKKAVSRTKAGHPMQCHLMDSSCDRGSQSRDFGGKYLEVST
jgi:hypothetical protein